MKRFREITFWLFSCLFFLLAISFFSIDLIDDIIKRKMPSTGPIILIPVFIYAFIFCIKWLFSVLKEEKVNQKYLQESGLSQEEFDKEVAAGVAELKKADKDFKNPIKRIISHGISAILSLAGIIYFYLKLEKKGFIDLQLLLGLIICVLGFIFCLWWTYQEIRDRNK